MDLVLSGFGFVQWSRRQQFKTMRSRFRIKQQWLGQANGADQIRVQNSGASGGEDGSSATQLQTLSFSPRPSPNFPDYFCIQFHKSIILNKLMREDGVFEEKLSEVRELKRTVGKGLARLALGKRGSG
ncbi:hypothetical protein ACFX12_046227 [Malus domestica]